MNGHQMEAYFSNAVSEKTEQIFRTGKFNKLLSFSSIPSDATIRDINSKVAGVTELFYAPIWQALYCLESGSVDIQDRLECSDPIVVQHIFEPQRDARGNLVRKELHKKDIDEVFKIGSFSSLSCLILLHYELDGQRCCVNQHYLEKLIVAGFINLCALKKIPCLNWLIFDRLTDWLFQQKKPVYRFIPNSEAALAKAIAHRVQFLRDFAKIKVRLPEDSKILLASLFSLGNQKLIHREITKFLKGKNFDHAPKDEKGLCWVISKLNASRLRSDKVQLITINNKIQIIYPSYH